MTTETQVIDKLVDFDVDPATDQLLIKHEQFIPDEHIARLKREKIDTLHTPTGDFYRVASIPVSVVEQMKRAGLDIHQASLKDILAYLNKQHMDAFITTNKRIT